MSIYVCDPDIDNATAPSKLNKSGPFACFVRNVLPAVLGRMKQDHGWKSVPWVVDAEFSGALGQANLRSLAGPQSSETRWLTNHVGDVYVDETVISHIRRLLRETFVCA